MQKVLGKKIEYYIKTDQWAMARKVITKALQKTPKDHWLLSRLSLVYYEQKKYREAIKLDKKAFAIAPDCPLVIWGYAGSLDALGFYKDAISMYKKIVSKKIEVLAYGDCGEGIRYAKSLVNDSFYRIAKCYKKNGNIKNAEKFYQMYLGGRKNKIRSIYNIAEIKKNWSSISL